MRSAAHKSHGSEGEVNICSRKTTTRASVHLFKVIFWSSSHLFLTRDFPRRQFYRIRSNRRAAPISCARALLSFFLIFFLFFFCPPPSPFPSARISKSRRPHMPRTTFPPPPLPKISRIYISLNISFVMCVRSFFQVVAHIFAINVTRGGGTLPRQVGAYVQTPAHLPGRAHVTSVTKVTNFPLVNDGRFTMLGELDKRVMESSRCQFMILLFMNIILCINALRLSPSSSRRAHTCTRVLRVQNRFEIEMYFCSVFVQDENVKHCDSVLYRPAKRA